MSIPFIQMICGIIESVQGIWFILQNACIFRLHWVKMVETYKDVVNINIFRLYEVKMYKDVVHINGFRYYGVKKDGWNVWRSCIYHTWI